MRSGLTVLLLFTLLSCSTAFSDEQHHHAAMPSETEQLGTVTFPTSCAPTVEKRFERAVALLHSFQYEASEKAFREVAEKDSKCAMAWWGVAMTFSHPIWEKPGAETLKRGWKNIQKANKLRARTEREREYIAAATIFYKKDKKLDDSVRAAAYAQEMEKLYEHYPQDSEAATFYALALLGSEPPHDTTFANRRKAIAVLNKLFASQPDHPGAVHYLIHSADVPRLASEGLDAARRYALIAPSSAHALHMPSHIFTRLGLWQESIDSNLASAAAAEKATKAGLGDASYQLHAMSFLHYAYLQSGRSAEARELIEALKSVPGTTEEQLASMSAEFQARYAIELHRWSEAATLVLPAKSKVGEVDTYWARAMGAARTGDVAGARQSLKKLAEARAASSEKKQEYSASSEENIGQQEAEAWLAYAEGKNDDAVRLMRAAADLEDSTGPDSLAMPAREMLGDLLLELKQPDRALAEYEASLKQAPNRFDSIYGAARAAELSGDAAKAKSYYATLAQVSQHPGADRPELDEARVFLAMH